MSLPSARQPRTPAGPGLEWLKIVLMGFFLAALLFVTFFYKPVGAIVDSDEPLLYEDATPVPELDPEILALARDQTRTDRLVTDVKPLEHLLEKSLRVTPSVARKLNMPEVPVPISRLQNSPNRYRGKYLWYKGQLEYLSRPKPGHPVPNYSYYEGRLRTAEDEPVLFAFSVPPPADLREGDWIRVEGFFLKLRDAHLPVPLDRVPMLVGPEVFEAYADWEAVDQLDPAVLARVRDGTWVKDSVFEDGEDMDKLLVDSQDVPLWHLASFARHQLDVASPAEWSAVPAFVQREQFEQFRRGEVARGTPLRILGTFVQGRILPARINPLGIEAWTEVWLQVRDLGGKTIPVWIPDRIDREVNWKRNMPAVCNGYFFKRYRYATVEGEVRWTPLFVAARLDRFILSENPLSNAITMAFAGLVSFVGLTFFLMARRDRRQRARHEAELVERRRRRRGREATAVGQQPCTS